MCFLYLFQRSPIYFPAAIKRKSSRKGLPRTPRKAARSAHLLSNPGGAAISSGALSVGHPSQFVLGCRTRRCVLFKYIIGQGYFQINLPFPADPSGNFHYVQTKGSDQSLGEPGQLKHARRKSLAHHKYVKMSCAFLMTLPDLYFFRFTILLNTVRNAFRVLFIICLYQARDLHCINAACQYTSRTPSCINIPCA